MHLNFIFENGKRKKGQHGEREHTEEADRVSVAATGWGRVHRYNLSHGPGNRSTAHGK